MSTLGIKIIGPAMNINFYGNATREIALALSSLGENVALGDTTGQGDFTVKISDAETQAINQLKSVNLQPPFVAIHINSPERINFVDNGAIANIAWTATDTLTVPLLSSLMMASPLLKEVWVPNAQKSAFIDSTYIPPAKLSTMQFGVNTEKFNPNKKESAKSTLGFTDKDAFYFGFIGSLKYTSGFDLVLRAFFEEFKNDKNVKLVFKSFMGNLNGNQEKDLIYKVIKDYKKDSQAELLYLAGNQSDEFMTMLHHGIDCLVSPARSKAWNSSVIKCMAAGVPTIANTHAGNKSYTAKETNTLLTGSKNSKITNIDWLVQNLIHQGCEWSEPNFDELKKAMRNEYENRMKESAIVPTARKRVEKLDWKNIAMEVSKSIQKYA